MKHKIVTVFNLGVIVMQNLYLTDNFAHTTAEDRNSTPLTVNARFSIYYHYY